MFLLSRCLVRGMQPGTRGMGRLRNGPSCSDGDRRFGRKRPLTSSWLVPASRFKAKDPDFTPCSCWAVGIIHCLIVIDAQANALRS